jgi:nucleotide-binding universal stress UspA family protein
MFKKILVPLDGSELAEAALPAARFLAQALGAQVTLIHIVEADAPPTIHGDRHLRTMEEAEDYLNELRRRTGLSDSRIACHVHASATANVVQAIVEHQTELASELMIMCTHGRGGIRRLFIGSIAQQVAALGSTPVLLIRPREEAKDVPFKLKTLLAPLDGEQAHEDGLDIALGLARATSAKLHLLSVIPTMGKLSGHDATLGKFMPGTTKAILQLAEDGLKTYLIETVSRMGRTGIETTAEIARGDPGPLISETADALDADLIVLATHGRAGNEAFWTNSVAAKVQALTKRPLLLVPIQLAREKTTAT